MNRIVCGATQRTAASELLFWVILLVITKYHHKSTFGAVSRCTDECHFRPMVPPLAQVLRRSLTVGTGHGASLMDAVYRLTTSE